MKKDKIRVFILEVLLIAILFFALFALNTYTRVILSVVISIYAFVVACFLKRRKIISINKRQVAMLMTIFAMVYLAIFYLLGLYFGFIKSKILLSISTIFKFIIPIAMIIISSEILRRIFLSHKVELKFHGKKMDISVILTYIAMVIIDLLIYTEVYDLARLDDFLTVLGFVFFAALSCNLLYNYITSRYGSKGIVIFRLITILYIYIFPIVPDMYVFFKAFLRMLFPYFVYIILEKLYSKNDYTIAVQDKKKEIFENTILLTIATLLVMLISCKFRYGIIVVGSGSMTGVLNKGDAVIFEKYTEQKIQIGQIIIFEYNNIQTIHRVVDIQKVNGENRYYTKGDANNKNDNDYRTDKDIYALVELRVKYIGLPTLWVRNLFS